MKSLNFQPYPENVRIGSPIDEDYSLENIIQDFADSIILDLWRILNFDYLDDAGKSLKGKIKTKKVNKEFFGCLWLYKHQIEKCFKEKRTIRNEPYRVGWATFILGEIERQLQLTLGRCLIYIDTEGQKTEREKYLQEKVNLKIAGLSSTFQNKKLATMLGEREIEIEIEQRSKMAVSIENLIKAVECIFRPQLSTHSGLKFPPIPV